MKNSSDINIEKSFFGGCIIKIQKSEATDGTPQQGVTVTLSDLGKGKAEPQDFFEASVATSDDNVEFETNEQWLVDDLLMGDCIIATAVSVMVDRSGRDLNLAVGYREKGKNSQLKMISFHARNCKDNGNIYISNPVARNVWEIETL